ncbi:putative ferric-chelate reductase 1 homolog isoform X1 [Anopheles funestus]|uniref:putative ferric-chelate reductase 1 homolog isoform X1 n=1 Tax=Anopheles funestus TaxID=62324 RepID=UPI0020C725D4|nr:putative ferric-chelate reductase 1 homolog isoform X1 [Anopheles funestus]
MSFPLILSPPIRASSNVTGHSHDHDHPSVLKRLHGTFMVIAWLFFNSLGNTVARYFKKTWTNRQYFGVPVWIFYHRVYMMACWTLTCAAIICIFIDLEGFEAHAHSIVGLATFALVFVQPILGLIRPPQQQAQSAIRILHSLLGHGAYILAVTNMFLGVGLESAHISSVMYGLVGGALGVHVLAHAAFNVLEYLARRKGSELDVNKDASFSRWRKTTLMLQMIALYAFAIVNVVYVWRV